ncbi:MAG TPA: hypothetical protein VE995_09080 [Gaiellaceae bacterium]|nr:hypothetical protein [Gaiellaceae bacterium]
MTEVWIEAPGPEAASLLQGRLGAAAAVVSAPGRCELRVAEVHLAQLPTVLAAVESWMADEGIGSIAVRLDERSYVLVRGV